MTIRKHCRAITKRIYIPTPAEALRRAWSCFRRGKNAPLWVAFRVF